MFNKHKEKARRAGGAADLTSDSAKALEERRTIHGRRVEPLAEGEKFDHLAKREAEAEDRQEALLDEAIEETFPGSDPISPKHIT